MDGWMDGREDDRRFCEGCVLYHIISVVTGGFEGEFVGRREGGIYHK